MANDGTAGSVAVDCSFLSLDVTHGVSGRLVALKCGCGQLKDDFWQKISSLEMIFAIASTQILSFARRYGDKRYQVLSSRLEGWFCEAVGLKFHRVFLSSIFFLASLPFSLILCFVLSGSFFSWFQW